MEGTWGRERPAEARQLGHGAAVGTREPQPARGGDGAAGRRAGRGPAAALRPRRALPQTSALGSRDALRPGGGEAGVQAAIFPAGRRVGFAPGARAGSRSAERGAAAPRRPVASGQCLLRCRRWARLWALTPGARRAVGERWPRSPRDKALPAGALRCPRSGLSPALLLFAPAPGAIDRAVAAGELAGSQTCRSGYQIWSVRAPAREEGTQSSFDLRQLFLVARSG